MVWCDTGIEPEIAKPSPRGNIVKLFGWSETRPWLPELVIFMFRVMTSYAVACVCCTKNGLGAFRCFGDPAVRDEEEEDGVRRGRSRSVLVFFPS